MIKKQELIEILMRDCNSLNALANAFLKGGAPYRDKILLGIQGHISMAIRELRKEVVAENATTTEIICKVNGLPCCLCQMSCNSMEEVKDG